LEKVARNFSDPQIGLVTGWTRYRRGETDEVPGLYSRLEKAVKLAESRVSSCVGADGAIFAVRKSLYRPLDAADINDFIIPLRVVGLKHRAVLDPQVYCVEEPAEGFLAEFRRQIRITNRTLGAIRRNPDFLNPFSSGRFAWLLLSHKLLRFMVPFFAAAMLASCLWLSLTNNLFLGLLAVVLLFILVGAVGLARLADSRVVNLCSLFLLTSVAQAVAWVRFIAGKSDTLWTPQR
jgi:cellulose synthase/poly-beta-1,6-N-acetylglucosamine synthase-like glycosyltransferase